MKKGQAWMLKHPDKPTTEDLLLEQKTIQAHNTHHDQVKKIKENHTTITDKKKEYDKMTGEINDFIQKKKDIFKANPLPVPGLTFTDDMLLYKDLPFNSEQLPTSTMIGVGVSIAMAMNPNLRVIIIRDGSLLDKDLFNKILTMVEKNNYQLFIEMVNWEKSDLEIKFIEKEV